MKVECKKKTLLRLMLEVMVVHESKEREQERGWGGFLRRRDVKSLREIKGL